MADWATVAVAGISAAAGIAGSLVTGMMAFRIQRNTHAREDRLLFHQRTETLYLELEEVMRSASFNQPEALKALQAKSAEGLNFKPVTLAKVRSMIRLHFPHLQKHLDEFDRFSSDRSAELRAKVERDFDNAVAITTEHMLLYNMKISQLCVELQKALDARSEEPERRRRPIFRRARNRE